MSWAKSTRAARSCLSQAQRKVTARCFPELRVEGAAPARAASAGGGEAGAAVAELGQQGGRAHRAGPGQAPEGAAVRVQGQLLADPRLQLGDLGDQRAQHAHEAAGDGRLGVGRLAAQAVRCGPEAAHQPGAGVRPQ